jgi:hypothetical protein
LEKWLTQKKTRGTCPTCRGILFQEPTSDSSSDDEPSLAPPVSPAQFFEYYSLTANVLNSARASFLRQSWDYIHGHITDESAAPSVALDTWQQVVDAHARMGAVDSDSRREFTILAPYVERLSNIESENGCVLCWLAETLWKLTKLCKSGLSGPPDFMWGAILFVHTDPNRTLPVFELPELRKATWALYKAHVDGQATGNHWRLLYLFLWCIAIDYISATDEGTSQYKIGAVRDLLLDFSHDDLAWDSGTRLLLSAAVYALERSKIGMDRSTDERDRRLRDYMYVTNCAQLKLDVESVWLEALKRGADDVAAGFPESW